MLGDPAFASGWPPALSSDEGELRFDGCSLAALAEEFGTPTWVLSRSMIEDNFRRFTGAFRARLPEVEVAYSMKANNTLAVVRMLSRLGALMDCTGESEIRLALAAGVPPGDIILNGNGKSEAALRAAAELGIRQVNLDSLPEADRLEACAATTGTQVPCTVRVQLTYRALLEQDPSFESTLRIGEGKFGAGIASGEAMRLVRHVIASPHLRFVGLHHHVGFSGYLGDYTAEREVMHHRECVAELCSFAREITRELDSCCERFDLGGGFRGGETIYLSTPGDGTDGELHPLPEVTDYSNAIGEVIDAELPADERPMLQFETGGYQVADAALFLARVVDVKERHANPERRFVTIDGSMQMFTSKGTMRVASEVVVVGAPRAAPDPGGLTDLVGQTCVYDAVAEAVRLPALVPGDLVALLKHGAYCDTTGTQMNATPRPGTVLADAGRAIEVRRPERLGDLAARDSIPAFLWTPAA
jgi:diaminopimelate decarboxylase